MSNKKEKKTLINRIFSKDEDGDEIKKLKDLKKRVKRIKTVEELEEIEDELDELGILDKVEEIREEKRKKKKRKTDREIFEERVRVNLEIINRTVLVGKLFEKKQRDQRIQNLLDVNKKDTLKDIRDNESGEENKIPNDRVRDKDAEIKKLKDEIEREGQKAKARARGERTR